MPNIEHNGAHLQYQHHGTTGPNVLFIMDCCRSLASQLTRAPNTESSTDEARTRGSGQGSGGDLGRKEGESAPAPAPIPLYQVRRPRGLKHSSLDGLMHA